MLSDLSAADWGNCEVDVFQPVHFESDPTLSTAETVP